MQINNLFIYVSMMGLSHFLSSVKGSKEKKGVVSLQEAVQLFETAFYYDTTLLRLDEIDTIMQLKQKIEKTDEDSFGGFNKQTREDMKKYIEKYDNEMTLFKEIDEIERIKNGLILFLQKTAKQFNGIPVNLIEEKVKTHSLQRPLEEVKSYFIEGRCLESQFLRDSIDPYHPLDNMNTFKHIEFQVQTLIIALNGIIFHTHERAFKKQVQGLLNCLGDRRFDKNRPHEDVFSDLQKKMAHVTKQGLLVSLY